MFGLSWILATLGGWVIKAGSNKLLRDVAGTLLGTSDSQSAVAVKEIDAEIAARAGAREIRLATAGFWEMRLITFIIAGCVTLHFAAVTLDTVFRFGWGVPKFPAPMDEWQAVIILSFFGLQAGLGLLRTGAAVLMGRR